MLSRIGSFVGILLFVILPVGVLGWIYEQLNKGPLGAIIFCLGIVGFFYTMTRLKVIK